MDYFEIIKRLYPAAVLDMAGEGNVGLRTSSDEYGQMVTEIYLWLLPYPQPTIEELDAYAQSNEYQTARLSQAKAAATEVVNEQANAEVIRRGILTGQLFFTANVSDIGFLVTEWRSAGRPTDLDPATYHRAYTEASAYQETSDPEMTPYKMLLTWEAQWNWMRQAFADLNYTRRLALERIKLATSEAEIAAALAGLAWG